MSSKRSKIIRSFLNKIDDIMYYRVVHIALLVKASEDRKNNKHDIDMTYLLPSPAISAKQLRH